MKIFSTAVKYIVLPCSSLVGIIYGFDMYVISRATTVVEPVKVEVKAISKNSDETLLRVRNIEKILMEKNQ